MALHDGHVDSPTPSPTTAEWRALPEEAWSDIQETTSLAWEAWVSLFPGHTLWDPVGAALTLTLFVGLIIWLVKVRPG